MEIQVFAGGDMLDVFDTGGQVVQHGVRNLARGNELLEGTRQGADAPFGTFLGKLGEYVEQQVGVGESVGTGPIRSVYLFLDFGPVKVAVGKTVYGEYVAVFFIEPSPEGGQLVPGGQFPGGISPEAQANGIRLARCHRESYAQDVFFKRGKGFLPTSSAMNVGAIGEVDAMGELHDSEETNGIRV